MIKSRLATTLVMITIILGVITAFAINYLTQVNMSVVIHKIGCEVYDANGIILNSLKI